MPAILALRQAEAGEGGWGQSGVHGKTLPLHFSTVFIQGDERKKVRGRKRGSRKGGNNSLEQLRFPMIPFLRACADPSFLELPRILTITTTFILVCMSGFLSVTSSKAVPKCLCLHVI